jgi:hypothetical protein
VGEKTWRRGVLLEGVRALLLLPAEGLGAVTGTEMGANALDFPPAL